MICESILGDDRRLRLFESLKVPSVFCGKTIKQLATKIGVTYYKFLDKYR